MQRSVGYAQRQARDQSALRQRIRDIAMSRPRLGYRRNYGPKRMHGDASDRALHLRYVDQGKVSNEALKRRWKDIERFVQTYLF